MTVFYAVFGAINVAFWVADPNPWSVFGTVSCALLFVAEMARES